MKLKARKAWSGKRTGASTFADAPIVRVKHPKCWVCRVRNCTSRKARYCAGCSDEVREENVRWHAKRQYQRFKESRA